MFKMILSVIAIFFTSICLATLQRSDSHDESRLPKENETSKQEKITGLYLDSSEGDSIGRGEVRCFLAGEENQFSAFSSSPNVVSVRFSNFKEDWHTDFVAPYGEILTTGTYKNAKQFCEIGNPGLICAGYGRCCSKSSGEFEILELAYGEKGKVEAFAANFIQRCEASEPPLFGNIRYNSSVALNPLFFEPLKESLILYLECSYNENSCKDSWTVESNERGYSIGPLLFGGQGITLRVFGSADGPWSFSFAAPEGQTFEEKEYHDVDIYPSFESDLPGMRIETQEEIFLYEKGKFTVQNLEKNALGEVVSLSVDFEAIGQNNELVKGSIRLNSSDPITDSYLHNDL